MIDINEKVDEYFYPQSKILKEFGVPKELYMHNVLDFRKYLWYYNRKIQCVHFTQDVYFGGFMRIVVDIFENPERCVGIRIKNDKFNLAVILVDDIFENPGRYFVIVRIDREVEFEDGKYMRLYEEV